MTRTSGGRWLSGGATIFNIKLLSGVSRTRSRGVVVVCGLFKCWRLLSSRRSATPTRAVRLLSGVHLLYCMALLAGTSTYGPEMLQCAQAEIVRRRLCRDKNIWLCLQELVLRS